MNACPFRSIEPDCTRHASEALFADPDIGRGAVYIADGGATVPVRLIARRADAVTEFGDARLWTETTRVDLQVAEVPNPRPGDRIEINGDAFLIQGEPVRRGAGLVERPRDRRRATYRAADPLEKRVLADNPHASGGQIHTRGPSLLVAEGRLNTKGRAVASRSKTGRGVATVSIFLLVPQVKLPKRLDLGRDATRAVEGVPGLIVSNWVEGKLG